MTATLAIYDLDEVYANSLMKYINQKQNMPFKATAFTNKEALEEYLQDNHIDILLVDYNLYDEYLEHPLSHQAHELLHTDHTAWDMPMAPIMDQEEEEDNYS